MTIEESNTKRVYINVAVTANAIIMAKKRVDANVTANASKPTKKIVDAKIVEMTNETKIANDNELINNAKKAHINIVTNINANIMTTINRATNNAKKMQANIATSNKGSYARRVYINKATNVDKNNIRSKCQHNGYCKYNYNGQEESRCQYTNNPNIIANNARVDSKVAVIVNANKTASNRRECVLMYR